eukprot:c3907_g1_i1.p2 GENE.c3907_g1_i1~~c3907_g1_i1.p2  ORF type:complete len:160 (+),score=39.54 c3907_g1_i1:316-795(+)
MYVSATGVQVLRPHTDPYDVLVYQLTGSKHWRTCVPKIGIVEMVRSAGRYHGSNPPKWNIQELSDAQLCMLNELLHENVRGCNVYSVEEVDSLSCQNFEMLPGDVLYMPKGLVHYALTGNETQSHHITIGLHQDKLRWLDAFQVVLEYASSNVQVCRRT